MRTARGAFRTSGRGYESQQPVIGCRRAAAAIAIVREHVERSVGSGLDITQHDETVSTRGVRAAFESMQGELFSKQ